MDFNRAVDELDGYLQAKPNHNVKAILAFMQELCYVTWMPLSDQQEFANMCSNFDKYVKATNRTSIGRKQFETLWEREFNMETKVNAYGTGTYKADPLEEDPLPKFGINDAVEKIAEYTETVDNSKDAHSLKVENTRLRNGNAQLKAELKAANDKLEAIRGIILWA